MKSYHNGFLSSSLTLTSVGSTILTLLEDNFFFGFASGTFRLDGFSSGTFAGML